jgi:hypothetical protein
MIMSPGAAASIAFWIVPVLYCDNGAGVAPGAIASVGFLPPIVTVTASTDCLPLPAVMTSSPHCAALCPCCVIGQFGTPVGTAPVIVRSLQLTPVRGCATPSAPTSATVPAAAPKP